MALEPTPELTAAYHELCAYTLTHGDPAFLHQHVVDAWAAQHATPAGKPISLTMALVGLYVHVEMGWTGRQAQRAHMQLAKRKRVWPAFTLPVDRGAIDAAQVLAAPAGPERDRAIHAWAACVWRAFEANRPTVVALLEDSGVFSRATPIEERR